MATVGGIRDSTSSAQNSTEIETLARFAVDEHNKKESKYLLAPNNMTLVASSPKVVKPVLTSRTRKNSLLEFARVVKAQEQVVAGTLHHLTLEAVDAGKKKLYEAKVWVKPWMNFKELQEFKHTGDAAS